MTSTLVFYTMVDPRHHGGVEEVVQATLRRCHAQGARVVEVRLARSASDRREMMALPAPPWRRVILSGPKAARGLQMSALLARLRPDVVNVHFVTTGLAFLLPLRRLLGFRLVLSGHGSDIHRPFTGSEERLGAILRGADRVTVVSAGMLEHVHRRFGVPRARLTLILNGIDHGFWSAGARRADPPATLIGTARLERVKGFDVLLDALAILKERGEVWHLTLAGDGVERGALEAQAARLGVGDRVTFAGHVTQDELRDRYRAARLFVMPSRGEGLPIALLEAMAAGLPFVATDVDGIGEIATEAAGRLVPSEDPRAFAEAILRIGRPEAFGAASAAARRRAAAFSREAMIDGYVETLTAGTDAAAPHPDAA